RLEVIHDLARVQDIPALTEVALHKPAHRWNPVWRHAAVENLQVDSGEVMIRIRIELSLIRRLRFDWRGVSGRIQVRFAASQSFDSRIDRLEPTQHVIEGSVLHHQDDDVFELVETSRHEPSSLTQERVRERHRNSPITYSTYRLRNGVRSSVFGTPHDISLTQ